MANYYWWKGTGSTFDDLVGLIGSEGWTAATDVGLTANWVMCPQTIGAGVTGATLLPGVDDTVYIKNTFPVVGSMFGSTNSADSSIILSPCLNSSDTGITCEQCFIGPFNIQGDVFNQYQFIGRVGGPINGNQGIQSLQEFPTNGTTLSGYPLTIRSGISYGVKIYDDHSGKYQINIRAGASAAPVVLLSGGGSGAISLASSPWKTETALRIYGSPSAIKINEGAFINELVIGNGVSLDVPSGTTASPVLDIQGQVSNLTVEASSTTNIRHVRVSPTVRCFDEAARGNYKFKSTIKRQGSTQNLSPQTDSSYADLLLHVPMRFPGLVSGTLLPYTVELGELQSAPTEYKFYAGDYHSDLGANIILKGKVILSDFVLDSGTIKFHPNNIDQQYGLTCDNARIQSYRSGSSNFGASVRSSPDADSRIISGALRIIHDGSTAGWGLRLGKETLDSLGTTTPVVSYYVGAVIETHTDSNLPY